MKTLAPPTGKRRPTIAQSPVQVAQLQVELDSLMALYRARAPRRVLEIGTFCGGTLWYFLQASEPGTTVVTVDSLVDAPDNRALFPDWCPEGVHCIPVIGDSHDPETVALVAEHAPFDFALIDGLHTYTSVQKDWELYRPLMAPGSVLALHDIRLVRDYPETNETAGVSKLWREIQEQGYVTQEIVCTPGQTEYGIGIAYT